jgi:hypothetical protein
MTRKKEIIITIEAVLMLVGSIIGFAVVISAIMHLGTK